jgi:hypothetical protein
MRVPAFVPQMTTQGPVPEICQKPCLALPCVIPCHLELAGPLTCDDVVQCVVSRGDGWGPRSLHCHDSGGGCGSGLTRCFTGLVPLP